MNWFNETPSRKEKSSATLRTLGINRNGNLLTTIFPWRVGILYYLLLLNSLNNSAGDRTGKPNRLAASRKCLGL